MKHDEHVIDHPRHYTQHPSGVECIAITEHMNFCVGNAIKYLWRAGLKANALDDLRKARWYIDREIARRTDCALDIEISVKPATKTKPIEIVQRKSKDAEIANPMYVALKQVQISGWTDEDGEPVTSAVIVAADNPIEHKKESAIAGHIKTMESAWWATGCAMADNLPYVSRHGMIDFLIANHGVSATTAQTYVKPGKSGRLIQSLLESEIIRAHCQGWVIVDQAVASTLLLRLQRQSC